MCLPLFAQYDRLPFHISVGLSIPSSTSNPTFKSTATGNLDWKNAFTYILKKKNSISLIYKRTNFKVGSLSNKFNTDIKTKYIINHYGVGYQRRLFDNDFFSIHSGVSAYYSSSVFTKVIVDGKEIKNLNKTFISLEPNIVLAYKASEYIDLSFQLSETITNYHFNPYEMLLDKSTIGVTYEKNKISNQRISFLSFGFQLIWYLQFEKAE
jgi:beta-xylosidase